MKKIIWIYSVNSKGARIISSGTGMAWKRSKKFQEELQKACSPEWELSFISLDVTDDTVPAGDVIVYNEMDRPYLSKAITERGLAISYIDLTHTNVNRVKQTIEDFYAKQ